MLARFWLFVGIASSLGAYSQCLTDFEKRLPEPATDYNVNYGSDIAMYDDYLAVGVPNSDSLGSQTGIVELFKKQNDQWIQIGILKPSNPVAGLSFGYALDMTENYIVVSASGFGGKIYVFKKPLTGWSTQTEIASMDVKSQTFFNNINISIDIAEDEQTIVAGNGVYQVPGVPVGAGAIFVFHKETPEEWNSSIPPHLIVNNNNFMGLNVVIHKNRIATFASNFNFTSSSIIIYKDDGNTFQNYSVEASLTEGANNMFWAADNMVLNDDGFFIAMSTDGIHNTIGFYQKPGNDIWTNSQPSCQIDPDGVSTTTQKAPVRIAFNGSELYAAFRNENDHGSVIRLSRGATGWCNPQRQLIHSQPAYPNQENKFAYKLACNQNTNLTLGFVNSPLSTTPTALQALFKKADQSWKTQALYAQVKNTAGHVYGNVILGREDYLFVGAPNDATVKLYGGAVYIYRKKADEWVKTEKILPPITNRYDDNFGSSLASNGTYLAIGASGFEEHGKTFIYKKTNNDWSNPQLVQVITPMDTLDAELSGTNILMTDEWLVLPVLRTPASFTSSLCFYKFNGSTWVYRQTLDVAPGNVLNKQQAASIDIQGGTIVMGNGIDNAQIIELTPSGLWKSKYILLPSDPENFAFNWLTGEVYSNGSLFGVSVDIDGDNIFVGAPMKDDGQTWDVGAVYVYTKRPEESWSSRTETRKLLPRIRDERELFGYALKALNNTVIVGAPGTDTKRDGTSRNKPGRAYVFQAKDYYWNNVIPLLDFTGDTFQTDQFGRTVSLDADYFFIGAPIEKNEDEKPAGAVYITPTPPIVKLVPPVCSSEESIDLFGYPFGGVWSGPGIIDAAEGIFDPKIAGAGVHEFTYKTESCTYLGHLRIEVEAPPAALIVGEPQKFICDDGPKSTTLSVEDQPSVYYHWYYRAKPTDPFTVIDGVSNSISVSKTGEYQAKVYNRSCESFSPIMFVSIESNPVVINPLPVICEDDVLSIPLQASPAGGTWSGNHVSNSTFNATNLSNGDYLVKYSYTSGRQCNYVSIAAVNVDRIPQLSYTRSSNNLCDAGSVELSLVPNNPVLTYTWQRITDSGNESINNTTPKLAVEENGSYQATISNAHCSRTLAPFTINDNFTVAVLPKDAESEACSLVPFFINTNGKPSDTFTWMYSETENGNYSALNITTPELEVPKSGFYKVQVDRGVCSFTSALKHITIMPGDSLFIPNIFTPNDDGFNDIFQVRTLHEGIDMIVMNRYGQKIFEGDGIRGWSGQDAPTGVYFWYISVADCEGTRQTRKGSVHLMR